MTIDEAIKYYLDIADGQDKCAEICVSEHAKERMSQCAADHRQLAEWLTELKAYKAGLKEIRTYLEHAKRSMTVHGVYEALEIIYSLVGNE